MASASFAQVETSATTLTLASARHTSEGSLLRLPSRIMHVFRLAAGEGGHVGNDGSMATRYSLDDGLTWSKSRVVLEHSFDLRNIRCGLVNSKILCFLRIYDAEKQAPVSLVYTVSDDGEAWTAPREVPGMPRLDEFFEMWIDNPITVEGSFIFTVHAVGYFEVYVAELNDDGLSNIDRLKRFDFRRHSHLDGIDEPELVVLPSGKAIVLYRDENTSKSGAFLSSVGVSGINDLQMPKSTDICKVENAKAVAPHVITATGPSSFLGIGSTRSRSQTLSSNDNLCIFEAAVDQNGDLNIIWQTTIDRPYPSDFRLYGYPISVPVGKSGTYLVVFTDAYLSDSGVEAADFFQFYIRDKGHEDPGIPPPVIKLTYEDRFIVPDGAQLKLIKIVPLGGVETIRVEPAEAELLIRLRASHRDHILSEAFDQVIGHLLGVTTSDEVFFDVADINNDSFLTAGDAVGLLRVKRDTNEPALRPYKSDERLATVFPIDRPLDWFSLPSTMQLRLIGDMNGSYIVQEEYVCPQFMGSNNIFVDAESGYEASFALSKELPYKLELRAAGAQDGLFEITDANTLKYMGTALPTVTQKFLVELSAISEGCNTSRSILVNVVADDLDFDGIKNRVDPDIDGDGVANEIDKFPFDVGEYLDHDSDGVGDKADSDLDNDGIPNWHDLDIDGDGDLNEVDVDPRNKML